ncbi:MAG: hypothetical protein K8R34_06855 [Methanosarcinales archaeon]|nr:hypothetical protein [Methanosarcinales archaeon]
MRGLRVLFFCRVVGAAVCDSGRGLGSEVMDADTILSEDERILVSESFKHEKEGKLVSLSEFKKDIVPAL